MEISTSFDTLSHQTVSRNGNGSVVSGAAPYRSSNRRRREDQLESLRSTLRSLRSYQEEVGNTSTLESRSTLRGARPPVASAATATVGGRRSFSNVGRGHSVVGAPSVAASSAPGPPPVPVDVIAAVHEVMGAQSQSGYAGLNSTLSGSRLTSRRGSACSSGGGGTLRRAPAVPSSSAGRQRRHSYTSNSRLSSAG